MVEILSEQVPFTFVLYCIVVVPALTPVTIPPVFTDTIEGFKLDQTPFALALIYKLLPIHN